MCVPRRERFRAAVKLSYSPDTDSLWWVMSKSQQNSSTIFCPQKWPLRTMILALFLQMCSEKILKSAGLFWIPQYLHTFCWSVLCVYICVCVLCVSLFVCPPSLCVCVRIAMTACVCVSISSSVFLSERILFISNFIFLPSICFVDSHPFINPFFSSPFFALSCWLSFSPSLHLTLPLSLLPVRLMWKTTDGLYP